MDENEQQDAYAIAAQRYAQMQEEKKIKEQEEQKNASASQASAPARRTLFVGATLSSERADRIAAVWFPLLREIFPESFNEEGKRKDFFKRMFKRIDNYMPRQWVKDLYKSLKNCNWGYLTDKDKVGLIPKEKDILSRSDSKRHRFMEIIKETTGITDASA